MLIGQDRFCVTVPGHRKVGGTLDSTGQDDCAADPCFKVLGRQGDSQRLWKNEEEQDKLRNASGHWFLKCQSHLCFRYNQNIKDTVLQRRDIIFLLKALSNGLC